MSSSTTSVVVKIKFEDDIRRVTLNTSICYSELIEMIRKMFPGLPSHFSIKYTDEDQDYITITSDIELQEAFSMTLAQVTKILRLFVITASKSAAKEVPASAPEAPKESAPASGESKFASIVGSCPLGADILRNPILGPMVSQFGQSIDRAPEQIQRELGTLFEQVKKLPRQTQTELKNLLNDLSGNQLFQDSVGPVLAELSRVVDTAPERFQEELIRVREQVKTLPESAQAQFQAVLGSILQCTMFRSMVGGLFGSASSAPPVFDFLSQMVRSFSAPSAPAPTSAPAPSSPAAETGHYRPPAARGAGFGRLFNRVASRCGPKMCARFVVDVTIADGTALLGGTAFVKTWRMRNTGEAQWPESTRLIYVGGDNLSDTIQVPVPAIKPNEEIDISVPMLSPREPGRYVSYWRLSQPDGKRFGHRVWVDIVSMAPAVSEAAVYISEDEIDMEEEEETKPLIPEPAQEYSKLFASMTVCVPEVPVPSVPSAEPEVCCPEPAEPEVCCPEPVVCTPAPLPVPVPHRFEEQLRQMAEMGFYDRELNTGFLEATGGDIIAALQHILG